MVTEKLAKAYFGQCGSPPPRTHSGFVQFLRLLGHTRQNEPDRIAGDFSFRRSTDFQNWIRSALPIAYDLERLVPTPANDGPNPEYPWPHTHPLIAPVNHKFTVWSTLESSQGRELMRIIRIAVAKFPEYADL
jgi:hypothetical protein